MIEQSAGVGPPGRREGSCMDCPEGEGEREDRGREGEGRREGGKERGKERGRERGRRERGKERGRERGKERGRESE